MDKSVIASLAKWPNVPAVYGWLSLDQRGQWWIKTEKLNHAHTLAFIQRNYASDTLGQWFFQNGPQRVYVQLEYTPWIYHLSSQHCLVTHTEGQVKNLKGIYIDEEGSILLETECGIGVLLDRDIVNFIDLLQNEQGKPLSDAILLQPPCSGTHLLVLWQGQQCTLQAIQRAEVAQQFNFIATPTAADEN